MASRSPGNDSKALHLKDLEKRWKVSRTTLYRWRKERQLPKGDIGPHRRIYSERLVSRIEESGLIEDVPRKRIAIDLTRSRITHGINLEGMSAVLQ